MLLPDRYLIFGDFEKMTKLLIKYDYSNKPLNNDIKKWFYNNGNIYYNYFIDKEQKIIFVITFFDSKKMLNKLNVKSCINCGLCSYVCPSKIELSEYLKIAKKKVDDRNEVWYKIWKLHKM